MRDYYARRTTSIESRLWEGGSAGWAEVAATRLPPPRPDTAGAERTTSPPVREGPLLRRCVSLLTVRRADTNEAIGNALVAKANGAGHRTIATGLDRRKQPCAAGSATPAAHMRRGGTSEACRRS